MASLVIIVAVITSAVPGILLGALCHWLLVGRIPDGWRWVLCTVVAVLPASSYPPLATLGAWAGTAPGLPSLLLWLPVAGWLERHARRASMKAARSASGDAEGVREADRPKGDVARVEAAAAHASLVDAYALEASAAEARAVGTSVAATPAVGVPASDGPAGGDPGGDPSAFDAASPRGASIAPPKAARKRRSAAEKIVRWLFLAPWLVPVGLACAVFGGLFGHFHESNGGLIIIVLGILFALLVNAIGVLALIVGALHVAWKRRA